MKISEFGTPSPFAYVSEISPAPVSPEETFKKLISNVQTYLKKKDLLVIQRAYAFANKAHEGQKRKSGEAFISHPVEVAYILSDLHMDADSIVAALLHDTVEDCSTTLEEVTLEFSPEVADLVDGVTKITRLEIESLSESQANNLRKMLIAMSKDIRVIVIKLADRLHNMRTLMALNEDRRIFKAKETMEIYAPLANRLGISSIKWELEDLAFFYLEPAKYRQVSRMVDESREAREEYLEKAIDLLRSEFKHLGLNAKIYGRPKHLYSIYQKMTSKAKDFSEIYDLIALRIIVDDVKNCYASLGAVHTLWHPMPGRFKDYIAMPKNNMYQSLHTTVIGPAGRPLEIQIRTQEMHEICEFGVASHWRYKEGGKSDNHSKTFDEELDWLRRLIDWQDETQDSKEFLEALKMDLFENDVFVFTPKGEVIELRTGSTPIDFAYAIHTEVGHRCVGAKVNGSIVPLSYELQMGDRVEVLTQKNSTPSRDWLSIVKTPSARSKIRGYFSKMTRDDDLVMGRDMVIKELRRLEAIPISASLKSKFAKEVAEDMSYSSSDDLFIAVGAGKQSARMVANRLMKLINKYTDASVSAVSQIKSVGVTGDMSSIISKPQVPSANRHHVDRSGIVIKGVDDAMVRLSRCCNPVPGDDIIGFVTRGRGVSVHRRSCPNAADLLKEPERLIDVSWANNSDTSYQVDILLSCTNRSRLLQEVSAALADFGADILAASASIQKDGFAEMRFTLELGNVNQIDIILSQLKGIEGVFESRRVLPSDNLTKKKARGNGKGL